MIYLAVFGALICAFLGGFCAQWLVLRYKQEDRCQPALDQLKKLEQMKERIAHEEAQIIETLPPTMRPKDKAKTVTASYRRQWNENIPAKDSN